MKSRRRSQRRTQKGLDGSQLLALKRQENTTTSTALWQGSTKSEETGVKPTKADRKKFDIDLAYGEVREDKIADMLTNKKIEVKSEKDLWQKTGNICIEYESWGKPSGIEATESDYWFHNLCVGDDEYCTLVFDTKVLKKIISINKFRSVSGGDNNASRMYLIPLNKLFLPEAIQGFKELEDENN